MTVNLARLDSLAERQEQLLVEMRADLKRGLKEMGDRVEAVEGRLEDSGHRLGELSQRLESSRSITTPDTSAASNLQGAALNPRQMFDTAYLDLTKGNHDLALMGFQDFVKVFPQSELADDAIYWSGECLYTQRKLPEAIAELSKVVADHPKGDKAAASLYKIGLIQLELKEKRQARSSLQKLIREYPRSVEAKLAKEKLATIR
jgi:tol-pal system protein YbgF